MNETSHVFEYQENGKTYIFDTGSPFSINYEVSELNQAFNKLYPNFENDITQLFGKKMEGLIGMDYIKNNVWSFEKNTLTLNKKDSSKNNWKSFNIDYYRGLPVVKVEIFDQIYNFWIDTGSSVNYIKDSLLPDIRDKEIKDFSPLLGWFESTGVTTKIKAFNFEIEKNIFAAPNEVVLLMGYKIDGILGYSFMSMFNWSLVNNCEVLLTDQLI